MTRGMRIAATVFCVVSILAICVAPLVDLPPTSLPSGHLVLLMMGWIIAGATILTFGALKPAHSPSGIWLGPYEREKRCAFRPIDANCVLQC